MVILTCTTIVLLSIAAICGVSFRKKLKMSIIQSTILGLTISIPILYMFILDILAWIGKQMFKVASLLAGIEMKELLLMMFAFQVESAMKEKGKVGGVSDSNNAVSEEDQKESKKESETEGDN